MSVAEPLIARALGRDVVRNLARLKSILESRPAAAPADILAPRLVNASLVVAGAPYLTGDAAQARATSAVRARMRNSSLMPL